MSSVTLQIPLDSDFKAAAQIAATREGFSSLQEVIRVFLKKLINKRVTFSIGEQFSDEILTSEEEAVLLKRSREAQRDIAEGRGFVATSAEEMVRQMRSHQK